MYGRIKSRFGAIRGATKGKLQGMRPIRSASKSRARKFPKLSAALAAVTIVASPIASHASNVQHRVRVPERVGMHDSLRTPNEMKQGNTMIQFTFPWDVIKGSEIRRSDAEPKSNPETSRGNRGRGEKRNKKAGSGKVIVYELRIEGIKPGSVEERMFREIQTHLNNPVELHIESARLFAYSVGELTDKLYQAISKKAEVMSLVEQLQKMPSASHLTDVEMRLLRLGNSYDGLLNEIGTELQEKMMREETKPKNKPRGIGASLELSKRK